MQIGDAWLILFSQIALMGSNEALPWYTAWILACLIPQMAWNLDIILSTLNILKIFLNNILKIIITFNYTIIIYDPD